MAQATRGSRDRGLGGSRRARGVHKKPVGRYTYLKELDNGDVVPCVVDVFKIAVREIRADFKEKGQRLLNWVSPDEAARRVREVELKSMLVTFKPHGKKKQA